MCVKRRLCGKAGTRASSGTFMRAVGRVGDLTGVLVNASLRTEGQKALLQVPSPPPTWYHLYRAIRPICIFYVLYFGRLRWLNCSPSSDLTGACEKKRTQFIALDLWGFLLDRFAHRALFFLGLLGLSPG